MIRWTALELLGVALIALALGFLHVGFAIGWVGLYVLVSSIAQQLMGGGAAEKESKRGED
ncbi:hypothetical protein UFOVP1383_23 [uncultured Caudovirales phage]|uniref:Uncharacterized protein n=1 Tax=uncultured Caudovirales phage TaxID=2100421 RepID=A0A6J5SLW8_9CAUD|nr:hypothetical protein UFOVP848_18 [uncultured Caudovirales phage]CAB4173389.1 hypothetical protein UFOVP945_47 [uncultured Caudovirales phage]CAB4179700.1 hypothetical protein UFOVP1023_54 [uncultured Caudovirales phage]CAB4204016.1 hypothetical protein UFOVP1383_23 [uncultured Caudovirales phage]CAB4215921.1 hypothetical protein UFOVP1477_25 [uncultured Caudovirales phage]